MKTVEFSVEGMSCGHCVKGVTNAITSVDGVQDVSVSLENNSATVTFDESKTSIDKIKQAVNDTEIYKAK
ncbi:MAG TPA: heavy metal-binding domain-containing protein [Flavobacteriales bacterium]|nr:heavy metal-binding domain-containing protein [Flavobacteriales bacterium]|tara:strand:+ start:128865 stop:129074 length:210 start_codon:yes stop_codon:yes gene_type:complete